MTLDELLSHPCAWFVDHDSEEIAISSRIRLARNVKNFPFPNRAKPAQRADVQDYLLEALRKQPAFTEGWTARNEEIPDQDRMLLFERSLISREHAESERGSAVGVSRDEQDVVMINEEDHLRLQVVRSGLSLDEAWEEMVSLDEALEQEVDYAFSETLGYLTCCPSNTGTGIRAGVMMHLPGLALMEEIRPVMRGLSKMGLAVRGPGGEGSEADGFLYQISNQITLGYSEAEILEGLTRVVRDLVDHERHARERLAQSRPNGLRDKVGRAVGILQHAWELNSKEALELLSLLRLGLAMELYELETPHVVEQLLVEVRPAHLQRLAGRALSPEGRDRFRAEWVRSKLAELHKGPRL